MDRQQQGDFGRKAMEDPDLRAKCAEAGRRVADDPAHRQRSVDGSKAYWSNPEARIAQSERKKKLVAAGDWVPPNGRTGEYEKDVRRVLEAEGCQVFGKGWPDFLVVYPDGRVKAIEVKCGSDYVRPAQQAVHEILRRLGIEVDVVHFPAPKRTKVAA